MPVGLGYVAVHGNVQFIPDPGSSGGFLGSPGEVTTITQKAWHSTEWLPQTRVCDGSYYPQACHHYSSVGSRHPVHQYIPCDLVWFDLIFTDRGRYPSRWISQHNSVWSKTWLPKTYINAAGQQARPRCQKDEWPPFALVKSCLFFFS